MNGYGSLLIYLVVAFFVALGMSFSSERLGPHSPGGLKRISYESGIVPKQTVGMFSVRFYRVAMLFMIFDVGVMSLYPWATSLQVLGRNGLLHAFIFLAILLVAFAYIWNRGGFTWD